MRAMTLLVSAVLSTLACTVAVSRPIDPAPIPDAVLARLPGLQPWALPPLLQEIQKHQSEIEALLAAVPEKGRRTGQGAVGAEDRAGDRLEPAQLSDVRHASRLLERTARRAAVAGKVAELQDLLGRVSKDDRLPAEWRANLLNRLEQLVAALNGVLHAQGRDERVQAVAELRALMQRLRPPQNDPAPDVLPDSSPTQAPIAPQPLPVTDLLPSYLTQAPVRSTQLALLGTSSLGDMLASAPAALEASTCNYQPADLADDGRNVRITEDIKQLAASLNYSPTRIAEWVQREIKLEPYFGAMKGSEGVLHTRAGGPTDIASLTIALLRASNIPARYVLGYATVADDAPAGADARIARWLGVKSYRAAKAVLTRGRFLASYFPTDASDNTARGVTYLHTWVSACVPFAHYRGSRSDPAGQRWVPIDTSFNQPSYPNPGRPMDGQAFDFDGFMAKRTQHLPLEHFEDQLSKYLALDSATPPCNPTLEDLARLAQTLRLPRPSGDLSIVPYVGKKPATRLEFLGESLPYDVSFVGWAGPGTSPETAVLMDQWQYRLKIVVRKPPVNGQPGAAIGTLDSLYLPEVVLKRLTLGFEGQNNTARSILASWRRDNNSSSPLPCPLLVVPELRIDGAPANLTGLAAIDLCASKNHHVQMEIHFNAVTHSQLGTIANAFTSRTTSPANLHALVVGARHVSISHMNARTKALLERIRKNDNPNADVDGIEGEFLYLVGQKYLWHTDQAISRLEALTGGVGGMGFMLGLTATQSKVGYAFDMLFGLNRRGYYIDIGAKYQSVRITDGESSSTFKEIAALSGSAFESYVWQESARTDAVSTVRGLQFAKENGLRILRLTKSNWAGTQFPYKSEVQPLADQYLLCGTCPDSSYILLPESKISYDEWIGSTIMVKYGSDEDGGYLMAIEGGYNGGWSVSNAIPPIYNPILNTGYNYYTPPPAINYNNWSIPTYVPPPPTINSAIGLGVTPYATFAGDPVNLVNGNVYHNEVDIRIKGRGGLDFIFERSYNSRDPKDGPLGFGWTHSLNQYLVFSDENPDATAGADDQDGVVSSVIWVDGSGSRKAMRASAGASVLEAPKGFFFSAGRHTDGTYYVQEKNGIRYIFENKVAASPANEAAAYSSRARLLRVEDRNGNKLTLGYAPTEGCTGAYPCRVTDDLNRSLSFAYNASGRLERLTDWTGREWRYAYDSSGNLVSFKNPRAVAGKQPGVTYDYYAEDDGANLNHALRSFTLPRGNGMTFEYYINGRAFRHYKTRDPSKVTTFTYNEFRRETVVTDENGNERRHFFDFNGNLEKVIEPDHGVRTYTYDCRSTTDCPFPFNRLREIDATGVETRYHYDGSGNLLKTELPAQGVTVERLDFGSNTFGQPRRVKDARGNWTVLRYDAKGNQTDEIQYKFSYVPVACASSECALPSANRVVGWTVRQYDSYGNATQVKRVRDFSTLAGPTQSSSYNDVANGTIGLNLVALTRHGDKTGDGVIDANDPADTAALSYDRLGRPQQGLDHAWYRYVVDEYDEVDRAIKVTDAAGRQTQTDYDANGNIKSKRVVVDGKVVSSQRFEYDDDDRLVASYDAAGAVTRYAYDAVGNQIGSVNPDGYAVEATYDELNRVVGAYDAEGELTQRQYDLGGRLTSETDALGIRRHFKYYGPEAAGRLKSVRLPAIQGAELGRETAYEYDQAGNVTAVAELGSAGGVRSHLFFYDEFNRLTRSIGPTVDGSQQQVCRVYSPLGDLTQVWVGAVPSSSGHDSGCAYNSGTKKQVTYLYDDFGRRLTETDPLGRVRSWTYDVHGRVLTAKDAKNQITTYTYKPDGLLEARKDHANRLTTWTYNALGQTQTVGDAHLTYTYGYDSAHRLSSIRDSRGNKTLAYSWSPGGRLNHVLDPEGRRTDYLYDGVGRLIGQWLPNDAFIGWGYDEGGRLEFRWSDTGVTTDYAWNDDGSLAVLKSTLDAVGTSGTPVLQHAYTYGQFGQAEQVLRTVSGTGVRWRYGYDAIGRLRDAWLMNMTPVPGPEYLFSSYRYDAAGLNMVRVAQADGSYAQYNHDAANQLSSIQQYGVDGALLSASATFGYDANGSLLTKAVTYPSGLNSTLTLTWSELNELKTAQITGTQSGSNVAATYGYDPLGRRISKTVGATTTHYLYAGADYLSEIHAEYQAWSVPKVVWSHAPGTDQPLVRQEYNANGSRGLTMDVHADGQGSVLAYSNNSASGSDVVLMQRQRGPWGDSLGHSGTSRLVSTYDWQGREREETGMYYYRARYYDADSLGQFAARFVSRDPLGLAGGLNLYAAFDHDPVNNADPAGLSTINPVSAATLGGWGANYLANLGMSNISSGYQNLGAVSYKAPAVSTRTQVSQAIQGWAVATGQKNVLDIPAAMWESDAFQNSYQTVKSVQSYLWPLDLLYQLNGGGLGAPGSGGLASAGASLPRVATKGAATGAESAVNGLKLNKSLASQAQMGEVGTTMAGAGARVPFRDAARVAKEHGGNAADWVKKSSSSHTARDGATFETHWVENVRTGQRVEFKTKFPGGD